MAHASQGRLKGGRLRHPQFESVHSAIGYQLTKNYKRALFTRLLTISRTSITRRDVENMQHLPYLARSTAV